MKRRGGTVVIVGMPNHPDIIRPGVEVPRYKKMQKEIAEKYGVPFVDMFNEWMKDKNVNNLFFPGDVIHPNIEGHRKIAFEILREMEDKRIISP